MKIVAITQARFGSSRLPGKVLMKIQDQTLLDIHLYRLKKSKIIDEIIVATTEEKEAELILNVVKNQQCNFYQGSMNDVLDRYYQAAVINKADWIVRVTSDCPLIDPSLLDDVIRQTIDGDYDYGTNTFDSAFPDGQDVEVFKFEALKRAWNEAKLESEREHVTPFIRNNTSIMGGTIFNGFNYTNGHAYSKVRMTVDEKSDFILTKEIVEKKGIECSWREYAEFILELGLDKINSDIIRNEGYQKSLKNDKK